MNVLDVQYLVDNNTLSQLSRSQRSSRFFLDHARIPSEVLHEAKGFPDIASLRLLEYFTTQSVLTQLTRVMKTIDPADTKLVDLYRNLGNADPLLVACALDGIERDTEMLFGATWTIVTDDKAVRAKAEEFEILVLSNRELILLVDDTENHPA